jgi:prepilin-type processing-associated H-X9-DG protein
MAMYHSPEQINAMTDKSDTYSNPQPPVVQRTSDVRFPSRKVVASEWLSNHDRIDQDAGWWCWKGTRNALFADWHCEYVLSVKVKAANNGFPDFNLTVDGVKGWDVD